MCVIFYALLNWLCYMNVLSTDIKVRRECYIDARY